MSPTSGEQVPPLNQIAFSVVDLRLTEQWFREGFGLLPAGGSRALMRGPLAARVQGLPRAASTCWWLVGRNPWFQLELFQFERPIAKLMPADFRPCDIGYTRIGIWVDRFRRHIENIALLGSPPLTAPLGNTARDAPASAIPTASMSKSWKTIRCRTQTRRAPRLPGGDSLSDTSVPHLGDAAAYFGEGIGLQPSTVRLHTPEHEALWGLAGARTETKLFDGGDVVVELVHYLDPVGKAWPNGYRVSDQGILNIAFGARSKRDFDTIYERAVAFGAKPNGRPIHLPGAGVVYVNDKHGFSVEVLWIRPGLRDRLLGFQRRPREKRPDPDTHRIEHTVTIEAPVARVWEVITNHDDMEQWIGFSPVTVIKAGRDRALRCGVRAADARSAGRRQDRRASHRHQPRAIPAVPRDARFAPDLSPGRSHLEAARRRHKTALGHTVSTQAGRHRPRASTRVANQAQRHAGQPTQALHRKTSI